MKETFIKPIIEVILINNNLNTGDDPLYASEYDPEEWRPA